MSNHQLHKMTSKWHLKRIWQIPTSNFLLHQCLECYLKKKKKEGTFRIMLYLIELSTSPKQSKSSNRTRKGTRWPPTSVLILCHKLTQKWTNIIKREEKHSMFFSWFTYRDEIGKEQDPSPDSHHLQCVRPLTSQPQFSGPTWQTWQENLTI